MTTLKRKKLSTKKKVKTTKNEKKPTEQQFVSNFEVMSVEAWDYMNEHEDYK